MVRDFAKEAIVKADTHSINFDELRAGKANIKVFGVGGAGCNTITWLFNKGINGATVYGVNTDALHLSITKADEKILIGKELTRGLGCGGYPAKGREAAKESLSELKRTTSNADMVFVCAGMGGGITGKGATLGVIDDPIKNAMEALNLTAQDAVELWYRGTFLSRLEKKALLILNMTRWATKDLCGRILTDKEEAKKWFILKMEAMDEDGNMLCDDILDREDYDDKKKNIMPTIFQANYHQNPRDLEGRLYKEFRLYTDEDRPKYDKIISYCDSADTGKDFLCNVIGGVMGRKCVVLDVYYSQASM